MPPGVVRKPLREGGGFMADRESITSPKVRTATGRRARHEACLAMHAMSSRELVPTTCSCRAGGRPNPVTGLRPSCRPLGPGPSGHHRQVLVPAGGRNSELYVTMVPVACKSLLDLSHDPFAIAGQSTVHGTFVPGWRL